MFFCHTLINKTSIDELLIQWLLIVLLLLHICFCFVMRETFVFFDDNQANGIEAFNSTSRYLDD